MNNHAQEHLQNSDKLMADSVRRDRHAIAHEAAEYIEAVLERLVYTQERIGELASVPFEPKDYTKPESTVTLDKPASKPDAFEQALIRNTRYDIRPTGILKAQNGQSYHMVSLKEANHLRMAIHAYAQQVSQKMYSDLVV
ncbi:hypothetical protein EB118_01545 [bacterium]|nr:hypothetical protein [bacterium]